MIFHCNHCGYEAYFAHQPAGTVYCEICETGQMLAGPRPDGFTDPVNIAVDGAYHYQVALSGNVQSAGTFNYFTGMVGARYQKFIREQTTYAGRFTNILVPDPERFAWLTPYTGNKHNRTHFTQLVLACVAQAKAEANGDVRPKLIEPFVGSGQIFLHACTWGKVLGDGNNPFSGVIAGDLNPYVIAAYKFILAYGGDVLQDYLRSAKAMDDSDGLGAEFGRVLTDLATQGRDRLADDLNVGRMHEAGMMYIWLVNRCLRGSSLNMQTMGINAQPNPQLTRATVRAREKRTLAAVLSLLRTIDFQAECRDFAATTALATDDDIVFMDCPFPKFAYTVPDIWPARPEDYGSVAANTYGTGDDGESLQRRIVDEARRLRDQGTTVILCNFANPGLIKAYRDLMTNVPAGDRRHFVYTYRSPSTQSEAYQLAIIPGQNVDFGGLPTIIRNRWVAAGGDDGYELDHQEFFDGQKKPQQDQMDVDSSSSEHDDSEDESYMPG